MRGFKCAEENEECKCHGKVDFGVWIDDDDAFFGKWSEMKIVHGQIKCEKANFTLDPETESDEKSKACFCYPSSNHPS